MKKNHVPTTWVVEKKKSYFNKIKRERKRYVATILINIAKCEVFNHTSGQYIFLKLKQLKGT